MKIGDRFVHKSGGADWRVLEVAEATDGTMMVKATIMDHDRDGTWFTIDSIRENYRVFSTPIGTKRKRESQEKYPVGTLLQGKVSRTYYKVKGKQNGYYALFDLTDNRDGFGYTNSEHAMNNDYDVVAHAFYVRDGVLRVTPELTGDEPDPLALSIEKWRVIVEAMERGETVHNENGLITCALCRVYHTDSGCSGCPVAKFVGRDVCHDTPYVWWTRSHSLAAAKAELAFLKELRDGVCATR